MDFGGDLAVLEPVVVFQIINMSGLTGALKLITTDNAARFYFKEGELVYATIETRRKRIGKFLVERELITQRQLDEVLEIYLARKKGRKIGHFLIEGGFLDREALVSAIQDQMKDVVYEALRWKSGKFEFFNREKPGEEDILLDVKLDHLILEGLKRLDESSVDE